ncbi:MAG TPA: zinc dependent phospholipase C family protein [Spirochaetia bacterium]
MPSHFTHLLFAEEALRKALGSQADDILTAHGNLFRFGAQGPDFFYHNQRTMPTGLRYGVALHRHDFVRFVEEMVREALRLSEGPGSELAAFTLGFATHGPLDRHAHPYIGYFAGWADPRKEAGLAQYHAHPFLERIIDVLILKERFGLEAADFDFLSKVRCGKTLPYPVIKAIVKGLNTVYPLYNYKSRDRRRIQNAYHDSIFFYKVTNHLNPDIARLAYKKDRKEGFKERRLGLLHPRYIPEGYDFLNMTHTAWCHPCDDTETRHESFLDLYEAALAECVPILKRLDAVIAGQAPLERLGDAVGNASLDTGRDPCTPRFNRPFPLREILEQMYAATGREMEETAARG